MDKQGSGHKGLLVYFVVGLPLMLQVGRKQAEDRALDGQKGEVMK